MQICFANFCVYGAGYSVWSSGLQQYYPTPYTKVSCLSFVVSCFSRRASPFQCVNWLGAVAFFISLFLPLPHYAIYIRGLMKVLCHWINRDYYTECCVIRLGIFTSQFYFFEPLRREKINLTNKNTAVLHNFPCSKLFIIRLGVFECKFVKRTPFNRSSFYGTAELKTWRAQLQITIPTNNPVLLNACCPVNNPEAFSVRTMTAWSNFGT